MGSVTAALQPFTTAKSDRTVKVGTYTVIAQRGTVELSSSKWGGGSNQPVGFARKGRGTEGYMLGFKDGTAAGFWCEETETLWTMSARGVWVCRTVETLEAAAALVAA